MYLGYRSLRFRAGPGQGDAAGKSARGPGEMEAGRDLTYMTAWSATGPTQAMATDWQPAGRDGERRLERAFAQANRHSRRVRILKIGLPVVAVAMVALFMARSWFTIPEGVSIDLSEVSVDGGRLVMAQPALEGLADGNRKYRMTAQRAIQDIGGGGPVDLEGINAVVPLEEGATMTISAEAGRFDRAANTLDIDTVIDMQADNGMRARLRSARFDIGAGSLDTSDPVEIFTEGGEIRADSMAVRDGGAVMIFENRVRVQLARPLQRDGEAGQDGVNGD